MSIEQKLLTKLQPHADRIASGSGNDFDYLPAVLLQVVEGQKRQVQAVAEAATTVARKLDETEVSISSVKATTDQVGTMVRRQMDLTSEATNERLDTISRQLVEVAQKAIAAEATEAQRSIAMEASIAALHTVSQKAHRKSHYLLISALVLIAVSICLAVGVVLRH